MRRLLQLPLRIPIFAIALIVGAVFLVRSCGPFPDAIRDRNHELLLEMPVYPGGTTLRQVDIETETSLLPGFGGFTTGVVTHRTDRMPAGATQERVQAWYVGNLSDWTRQPIDRGGCILFYRSGDASLVLTACGDPQVKEVRLQVDSDDPE